jgi:oligoendopeptidase F
VEIFREENVAIEVEISAERQRFSAIAGAMSVNIEGKEMTLQQAGVLLENPDRQVRENAYRKINERRLQDADALDEVFSNLVKHRHRIAVNAGFANFRDYSFKSMGRFDYTPQHCFDFHQSVANALVPVTDRLAQRRKQALGYSALRPWDYAVDVSGRPALKAFGSAEELVEKSIACFERLAPFLGECLATLKHMGRLDLDSRPGKAPGGYNYPLMETGIPFVFMNATSTVRDLVTMMHEGGHAVHSILIKDLALLSFKHLTPEIAELASMSMELMSMDHWDIFFEHPEDLRRAKAAHIESLLDTLPWIALIDRFQHWIYENPHHTDAARTQAWLELHEQFSPKTTSWEGLEHFRAKIWQKQLHLFELPFYYIEYGIAQLGAIAIWRNYRQNPQQALQQYINALSLGYTKPIPEMYAAAGVAFDFSKPYIEGLMQFVQEELEKL